MKREVRGRKFYDPIESGRTKNNVNNMKECAGLAL
jgi:hypothetical protein